MSSYPMEVRLRSPPDRPRSNARPTCKGCAPGREADAVSAIRLSRPGRCARACSSGTSSCKKGCVCVCGGGRTRVLAEPVRLSKSSSASTRASRSAWVRLWFTTAPPPPALTLTDLPAALLNEIPGTLPRAHTILARHVRGEAQVGRKREQFARRERLGQDVVLHDVCGEPAVAVRDALAVEANLAVHRLDTRCGRFAALARLAPVLWRHTVSAPHRATPCAGWRGAHAHARTLSRLVLPPPEGPIIESTWPGWTAPVRSSRIVLGVRTRRNGRPDWTCVREQRRRTWAGRAVSLSSG